MLSVLLFGLHKQPNTYTPTAAVGGIRLLAGRQFSGDRAWMLYGDDSGWASALLHTDYGVWFDDSYLGMGKKSSTGNSFAAISAIKVTSGSGANSVTAAQSAFDENSNRIGQSRSRKRIGTP